MPQYIANGRVYLTIALKTRIIWTQIASFILFLKNKINIGFKPAIKKALKRIIFNIASDYRL